MTDEFSSNISAAQHNRMLGIPLPKGTRGRFLKRIVYRLCRPFLYRQLLFNEAMVNAVDELARKMEQGDISNRNRINQVALEATSIIERVNSGLRQIDLEVAAQMSRLQNDSSSLSLQVLELRNDMQQQAQQLQNSLQLQEDSERQQNERMEEFNKASSHLAQSVNEVLAQFESSTHELHYLQTQTRTLLGKLRNMDAATPDSDHTAAVASARAAVMDGGEFESSYLSLQDTFRGSSTDIQQRLSVYVDDLRDAAQGGLPVLDLGCGRGDLLHILKAAGIHGYGIDQDALSAEYGRSTGLDIRVDDIFHHLTEVEPASIGAITAIHVVEHLDGATIMRFLGLCSRALVPGGLLILETPNPENVLVGSCSFYIDPTHVAPLPPELLDFMVRSAGYDGTEVRRFRRDTWWKHVPAEEMGAISVELRAFLEMVQDRFLAPEDYAVLAINPAK